MWNRYYRGTNTKERPEGSGLGLAIAKQLAEQMDGMIWVESVYGKGSSFFVQLPMKKVSDGKISNVEWKETDERKRRSFVAPQAKILIVDDNPENLMVTRSLLKRTAVFVDTAASGEECVHKVRQNVYDLILLDYMMPQMDGIDTIRELKKDVQFHIPVIALTADVTKGIEQTFLREGFCAYLSKPVMWSKLEDLLMKYLREEQKIKDEEFKQLKGQLKENDIKIEEGLRLLDGDFMQYRKLMEFFTEYQEEYMRQIVLSLLVDNNPGVLARVAALFSRRGYNIDSITAGITNDPKYTRITVAVSGDNQILEQIRNQIAKLVEVRKIVELENSHSVCRELVLVKVMADKKEKQEIIAIADIFRAKVVDVAANSLMIELTGNQNKLDAFLNLMADFEVLEMVRTGITGLGRGVSTLN